ncbi:hypothetical protein Hdeb2414_s0007g00229251 [Helianthus debilis subsp. tardiflorus]
MDSQIERLIELLVFINSLWNTKEKTSPEEIEIMVISTVPVASIN